MLDQAGLVDDLTAVEYLVLFGGLFGASRTCALKKASAVLERVGLVHEGRNRLGTFSKGMRQRVALARALMNDADVLILDEPFDGIDNESRRALLRELSESAQARGTSAFITSHNLTDIERISHRVAIVNHGRIIALDTVDNLQQKLHISERLVATLPTSVNAGTVRALYPDSDFDEATRQLTVVGGENGVHIETIGKQFIELGVPLGTIKILRPTLEDIYFQMIAEDDRCNS